MGTERVPPLTEARRKAEKMVNSVRLVTALMDGRIEQRLRDAAEIFRTAPQDLLPQVLLEETVVIGRVGTERELRDLLGQFQKAEAGSHRAGPHAE